MVRTAVPPPPPQSPVFTLLSLPRKVSDRKKLCSNFSLSISFCLFVLSFFSTFFYQTEELNYFLTPIFARASFNMCFSLISFISGPSLFWCGQHPLQGPLEGVGPENRDFLRQKTMHIAGSGKGYTITFILFTLLTVEMNTPSCPHPASGGRG